VVDSFATKSNVPLHRRGFLKTATALAGGALLPEMAWAALPECYDLRCVGGKNYITPVKDQDDPAPCNACTAFAVVATVEGTYNKFQSQPVAGLDFDEMKLFLSQQATPPSGGCATTHWWPKYALDVCKNYGLYKEDAPTQPVVKITNYQNLRNNNLNQTQNDMKQWLIDNGPVTTVMVQFEDFYEWGKLWAEKYPGVRNPYVYSPGADLDLCQPAASSPSCQCPPAASTRAVPPRAAETDLSAARRAPPATPKRNPGAIVGGHVVSIVGYDNNTTPASWICKNSWGNEWNGDGYVLIAQGKPGMPNFPKCYIDEIDVYGVSFRTP
jgi:C1A family cysteine protease